MSTSIHHQNGGSQTQSHKLVEQLGNRTMPQSILSFIHPIRRRSKNPQRKWFVRARLSSCAFPVRGDVCTLSDAAIQKPPV